MVEDNNISRCVVIGFNNQKRYGFNKLDDGTEDLFVHQSKIKSTATELQKGQVIEFLVALEGDKTQAIGVTGVNGVAVDNVRSKSYRGRGYGGGFGFSSRGYSRVGRVGKDIYLEIVSIMGITGAVLLVVVDMEWTVIIVVGMGIWPGTVTVTMTVTAKGIMCV